MLFPLQIAAGILSLASLSSAFESVTVSSSNAALSTRNAPGTTDFDTVNTVGQAFRRAVLQSRSTVYHMNDTSLAKSWDNAVLYGDSPDEIPDTDSVTDAWQSTGGIEIICSTCYFNGSVTGELTFKGDFNISAIAEDIYDEFKNDTDTFIDTLKDYAEKAVEDIATLQGVPAWPSIDYDLNLEDTSSKFSGAEVNFKFDNLELYIDLDIKLSEGATYTLNLFTSETAAGFSVPGATVGAIFSVDLILMADAEINVGTGIHLKLDDGLSFDLELFDHELSTISVPGGSYEFLPITIEGEGGTIQAVLSLKASVGVEVDTKSFFDDDLSFSVGVEADVFAYVADFLIDIDHNSADSTDECELSAVAEYTLAVGAAAGATIGVDSYQWGPNAYTTVPVWYTTLASTCVSSKSATSTGAATTARAEVDKRADLITTQVTSSATYTIVSCESSGLVNCPVNSQNTTSYEQTMMANVTVASGSSATYPAATYASVTNAVAFGSNVRSLDKISGSPTKYNAKSTGKGGVLDGTTNGTSNKLIIGLCVGLGIPFLAACAAGLWFFLKRGKKYDPTPQSDVMDQETQYTAYDPHAISLSTISKDVPRRGTLDSLLIERMTERRLDTLFPMIPMTN
ncbi:uncharacterized protein N7483_010887 [Penicillium malachiteum]|uniref:uncharacterized protein n=1 Tax=Penicillium malachiteum TaxID=1324776 RepID=UPI002546E00D|nr:uncharacterized protein N7483_010887 [Penicillium malachiteum]KAJ5713706.1 hypothetical protein N7483_010887 [Penicillium malachiteum]